MAPDRDPECSGDFGDLSFAFEPMGVRSPSNIWEELEYGVAPLPVLGAADDGVAYCCWFLEDGPDHPVSFSLFIIITCKTKKISNNNNNE